MAGPPYATPDGIAAAAAATRGRERRCREFCAPGARDRQRHPGARGARRAVAHRQRAPCRPTAMSSCAARCTFPPSDAEGRLILLGSDPAELFAHHRAQHRAPRRRRGCNARWSYDQHRRRRVAGAARGDAPGRPRVRAPRQRAAVVLRSRSPSRRPGRRAHARRDRRLLLSRSRSRRSPSRKRRRPRRARRDASGGSRELAARAGAARRRWSRAGCAVRRRCHRHGHQRIGERQRRRPSTPLPRRCRSRSA